eukprot:305574-Pyramimonas_sp.AAC.1
MIGGGDRTTTRRQKSLCSAGDDKMDLLSKSIRIIFRALALSSSSLDMLVRAIASALQPLRNNRG